MRDLGAEVTTAASIARAREAIELHPIDLAVLDFNLGAETSMPVADLLAVSFTAILFAVQFRRALAALGQPDAPQKAVDGNRKRD